jgi:transposase
LPTGNGAARRAAGHRCSIRPAYRRRNQVERGFNRRKHWRGVATRFDKLGAHYQATLDLVEMLDWLRPVPDGHDPRDRT